MNALVHRLCLVQHVQLQNIPCGQTRFLLLSALCVSIIEESRYHLGRVDDAGWHVLRDALKVSDNGSGTPRTIEWFMQRTEL